MIIATSHLWPPKKARTHFHDIRLPRLLDQALVDVAINTIVFVGEFAKAIALLSVERCCRRRTARNDNSSVRYGAAP